MLSVNLTKKLREKVKKRNIVVRKGDIVKIMKGKFKKKSGKVLRVFTKQGKITIEGIQVKKMDGSNALVKMQPSNLQITEMTERTKKTKEETKKKTEKAPQSSVPSAEGKVKKEESKTKTKEKKE